jgi:hypothetical protein
MPDSRRTYFIWVPVAIVILAAIAFLILTRMPFGGEPRQREPKVVGTTQPQVVTEAPPSVDTSMTIVEIGQPKQTTATQPIPAQTLPKTETTPPSVIVEERPAISEEEAVTLLHSYIAKNRSVSADCLVLLSEGLSTAGYTVSARDRCNQKSLGRWRLNAKTRAISQVRR